MTAFDLVIAGGFIADGTGSPGCYGDVGIIGDEIVAVGDLRGRNSKRTIDATGKIVAPGFVTQHTHYDAALFWDPYCLDAGRNGVTTVVNANCGFGVAPVRNQDRDRIMGMLETTEQIPVAHQKAALPWDWESFPDFMDRIRSLPKGVNVLTFLPLNPLLVYVMGVDAAKTRGPNPGELAEIHGLINDAMDAGAIGISMSVMGAEGNSHVDMDGSPMPTDLPGCGGSGRRRHPDAAANHVLWRQDHHRTRRRNGEGHTRACHTRSVFDARCCASSRVRRPCLA